MTQIHYEGIELPEIVEWSKLIVIATPADPDHRIEKVSILPKGSQFEGKNDPPYAPEAEYDPATPEAGRPDVNYPPYSRHWRIFDVHEVLKGDPAVAGTRIEARGSDDDVHLGSHCLYYIQGIGESPIVEAYQPTGRPGKTDVRILFLYVLEDGSGCEFVAEGAEEVVAMRGAVEALIAKS